MVSQMVFTNGFTNEDKIARR